MSDTDDLAGWLRHTLDRVEQQAREATSGTWADKGNGSIVHDGPSLSQTNENWGRYVVAGVGAYDGGRPTAADAEHIVFWQPARVLRLVEATRQRISWLLGQEHDMGSEPFPTYDSCRILLQPGELGDIDVGYCSCGLDVRRMLLLRFDALPFDDQPGYREEWRP